MVFVPVVNDMRVAIRYLSTQNSTASVTFDVGKAGTDWTTSQMQTILNTIATRWNSSIAPHLNQIWQPREIVGQHQAVEGEPIIVSTVAPVAGTGSTTPVSSQVAAILHKNTGTRGRHYEGRMLQFGLSSADLADSNHVNSTYQTAILAAWNLMLSDIAAVDIGAQIAVASRFKRGAEKHTVVPQTPAFFTFVQSFQMLTTRVGTARKRLIRVPD
jgi:hypothetical protein